MSRATLDVRAMSTHALFKRLESDLLELEAKMTGSPGRPAGVVVLEARQCVMALRSRTASGRLFED
jgi:hypothetical protein